MSNRNMSKGDRHALTIFILSAQQIGIYIKVTKKSL